METKFRDSNDRPQINCSDEVCSRPVADKLPGNIQFKEVIGRRFWFFLLILLVPQLGCKKLVQVAPPITSLNSGNVYTTDGTAIAVLTGIYAKMSNVPIAGFQSLPSTTIACGLSADELSVYSLSTLPDNLYYTNNLSAFSGGPELWNDIYPIINNCNDAISGLNSSSGLTPAVKQQLTGEAKFIRALCYFYLVNLYGDVPLAVSTDYKVNALLPRASVSEVYQQITNDLKAAQTLLSLNFLDATLLNTTQERTRPTKWAATALLARACLFSGNYQGADSAATAVIGNTAQFDLVSNLNGVFLKNSQEAIWQLQPVNTGYDTPDAQLFVLPTTGPDGVNWPVYLNPRLLNSFEQGDLRRTNWVDSVIVAGNTYYYPYKYKNNVLNGGVTEYEIVLRLSEQYLIRAEAEAEGIEGGINTAIADLNTIRTRAGLPGTTASDKTSLLTAILHERQVELFTEWGHRWLDLKRTGTVNAVMGPPGNACQAKGGIWNANGQLYPLPKSDLQLDPNLVQNAGY